MQYINLYDKLSKEDKDNLQYYINKFGISEKYFIGLDNWLENWSHANQKLYRLLGDQFIKEIDYEFEKSKKEIEREIYDKLYKSKFYKIYQDFLNNKIANLNINHETNKGFYCLLDNDNFIYDKIHYGFKYKRENNKKTLQIQEGMKPIKAIQKVINYFNDIFDFSNAYFEEFRLTHSLIFNTKKIKGKLCFSIHPLDYLTMSDNNSGWSSCMSWTENGCYHVGTIEMMNSNNVLCCYLKSNNDDFIFGAYNKWNNKKWRVLAYVTKDIIMSGKSYPYKKEELSKAVIYEIKKMAKENLNWNYSYGPELYQDMKYINSTYTVERAKKFIKYKDVKKHNIIWDTNGMYNDMLNDHYRTEYWCYRNKVSQTKVISVSGKANCLCCNDNIININEDTFDDYNERYSNCGSSVCTKCYKKLTCYKCGNFCTNDNIYRIKFEDSNEEFSLCSNCASRIIKYCPCCHKPMYLNNWTKTFYPYGEIKSEYNFELYPFPWNKYKDQSPIKKEIEGVYLCKNCFEKKKEFFIFIRKNQYTNVDYYVFDKNNFSYKEVIGFKKGFYQDLEDLPNLDILENNKIVQTF